MSKFTYSESYITPIGVKHTKTSILTDQDLLSLNFDNRTIQYIKNKGKYNGAIGNNRYCNIQLINS